MDGLYFAAMMPLLGIALYILITKVIPIFKRVFKQYDALNESAEENLAGIRSKVFVNEDFERKNSIRHQKICRPDLPKRNVSLL